MSEIVEAQDEGIDVFKDMDLPYSPETMEAIRRFQESSMYKEIIAEAVDFFAITRDVSA